MKSLTKLKQVEEPGKLSCVTQGYLASHVFGVNCHVIFQLDVSAQVQRDLVPSAEICQAQKYI